MKGGRRSFNVTLAEVGGKSRRQATWGVQAVQSSAPAVCDLDPTAKSVGGRDSGSGGEQESLLSALAF